MTRTVSTMEKLTYTNVNGYLIPNITYKSGNQMEQLGKYGFLRREDVYKRQEHSELQGYGMLTRNVSDIKHCNAGMFGDGVLGTLLVPDRNDLS